MSAIVPSQWTRSFGGVTAAIGAGTIIAAPMLARHAAGASGAIPDARIVRVLGARQLAQGALVATVPDPAMASLGAGSDLSHAASMVVLAVFSSRFRRPAVISGTLALASALAGSAVARRQRADPR